MSNPLQFSVEFGHRNPDHRRSPGEPLRILYMTDLGDSSRSRSDMPLETRPMRAVDIDAFEDLLNDENPSLVLPLGEIGFRELEDFHPDQICQQLPVFQNLKDLRSRLRTPSTFDKAAQEVRALLRPETDAADPAEDDSATLSRLFGASSDTASPAGQKSADRGFLGNLLQEAVAAHITAEADPKADQYVAAIDDACAAHLRSVLHDPAFQSLEAAWRGLDKLISEVETDEELSIHVWNVSKSELLNALAAPDAAPETAVLHRRIIDERENRPFTLIVSDLGFDPSPDDIRLLATLGAMAGRTNALVLAPVSPAMIGAASWQGMASAPETLTDAADDWNALRATPMAHHIVALGSRFLLRAPYGKRTDPIDALPFEELQHPGDASLPLLWGAPSLLAAILMAQSFRNGGWDAPMNQHLGFSDLPLVPIEANGESQILPCGEALFPDRSAETVLNRGVVPVMAIRNQNAIRLPWFQTASDVGPTGRLGPFSC